MPALAFRAPVLAAKAMIALAIAALAGCASLPDPLALLRGGADGNAAGAATAGGQPDSAKPDNARPESAKPDNAKPVAAATSAAPAAAAASAVAASPEPQAPPVDARAQQAFDAARRAMRAGRSDDAERQLKALAQAYPDLGGAHANLGLLYRQAGKLAESAAELEKAVQASPKQPVFHNQLGITYRQQGQFAKARDAYERAIALDAGYAAPVLNLGILNDLYLQDRKRALALYDQYLVIAGGDAVVTKWVADLKNRKDHHVALQLKEKP
ncbi:MAG: tetratricopeptide repeat protein [Ideonella sp.]|nr:tetratricopeptide repeat protein [Ideonella sp.]